MIRRPRCNAVTGRAPPAKGLAAQPDPAGFAVNKPLGVARPRPSGEGADRYLLFHPGMMAGSASARPRSGLPGVLDADVGTHSPARRRIVDLLAREPFAVFVPAIYALFLTAYLSDLFVQSDTWLALVGGRRVWRDGLPHHDTLTIWAHGSTWVDQQWLGQLAFYVLHALGGLRLLLVAHAALLVAAFALALAFARRSGASSRSVLLIGIVALVVALPNSTVRTQAFAYVFFVLLFWLLATDARAPSRRVFLAAPLLILWANTHGSAALGAALVILWGVAELVRAGRQAGAWNARRRAIALAVAAPLCLLVSPYGLGLVGYYRDVLGSSSFRGLVSEWHPTVFPEQGLFFLLALGGLWLAARKAGRLSLFEHLALLFTLVAGIDAVRNNVWFAFVAAMVVPRALDGVWPAGTAPLRRRINVALSLTSICVLAGAFVVLAARPSDWYGRSYSPRAVDAVATTTAQDRSIRILANERYADWLLWRVPRLSGRIAFDARFELLSSRQLHAIAHFRRKSSPDWLRAARGYRLLVLDPDKERAAVRAVLRESGARAIYRDHQVAVLLRHASRRAS
jgi:hypothetical protein